MVIVRLNSDGSTDPSFGSGGTSTIDLVPGTNSSISQMQVQADGKILISGSCGGFNYEDPNDIQDMVVARLTSSGNLDTSFATNGYIRLRPTDNWNSVGQILVQPDGKILLAGDGMAADGHPNWALVRLSTDLTTDFIFTASPYEGDENYLLSVSLQSDNKIVLGGSNGFLGFTIARLTTNGDLDTTFGTGGYFLYNGPDGDSSLSHLVVQPDDKIIVDGQMGGPDGFPKATIFRLLPNGGFDSSYGTNGFLSYSNSSWNNRYSDLHLLPDGRILAIRDEGGPFFIQRFWP